VEAMGLNASVLSASTAAYPLVGGVLATIAWNYPFYLAFLGVIVGFLVLLFLDNPEPQSSGNIKEYLTRTLGYLKNIRVWSVFLAGIVAFILLFGAALTYFALYMDDKFDASPFIIGVIISVNSIATVVVAMQLGRLTEMFSPANLVKLGFVLCAVAMAMVLSLPHLMLLIIPSAIFGVGFGIIFPCIHTYVAGLVPSSYRAVFMSVNTAMFQLGKTLGPLVVGAAYVYGSFSGAFLFSAGLAVVAAVIGVIGGRFIR
jgi:predicted MFS family arabinose efflux permease